MPHAAVARTANRNRDAGRYQRHRPEQTLRYRIVEEYYPAFTTRWAEQGRELPGDATAVSGCRTWVKRVFILPIPWLCSGSVSECSPLSCL